jgi:hypothetical protein
MLTRPARGFQRSVTAHNVNIAICCDWLEASVLFDDGEISGADVVDFLRENEIYADQDFAWELVNDAFSNIQERSRLMGQSYPIELIGRTRLQQKGEWQLYPAYSFCLALSLANCYPQWARGFGHDYTVQGELFEALTAESVRASLSDWTVYATGWTRTAPRRLSAIVADIAARLGETTGDIIRWSKQKANEAGLDLLCFRSFPDGRVGIPVYLIQCASGGDWHTKLKAPDLRIWTKIISFASDPKKAFSMPFALSTSDFTYHCNVVDGLLLDRHRLLSPGQHQREWVTPQLAARLIEWIDPRIAELPRVEV